MKLKSSRRQFLKDVNNLAITTSMVYGLESLFQVMMSRSVAHAAAATTGYDYRYISFLTGGGPPRWYFDQPLNPTGAASLFNPGNFGTNIKNVAGEWKAVHATKEIMFGGVKTHLPPVWALKQGGKGPAFSALLNETIMIRGLNMEINSHTVNRERTVRPVNASPSITGLVAQNAGKPITSLGHAGTSTSLAYKSADGSGAVNVNRANPVPGITSPFNQAEIIKYNNLDYSVQQALSAIDNYAKETQMASQGNENVLKNAYEMFSRNLAAFTKTYSDLVKKYDAIIKAEVAADFPGVTTDLAKIKSNGSQPFNYALNKPFAATDNLKTIVANATPPQMAAAFAFAEFAMKENLTNSMTLELGANFANVKGVGISQDQHYVGAIASTIFTNLYYRCVLGCMTEFRSSLVGLKVWDKTVVQMASEFSRTPTTVGRGSDHGFESGSTSIFSGMIKKPGLIGNIYTTPPASMAASYMGTWGHAAPFIKDPQTDQNRNIINDDVVRTICEMVEIPKIGTKGVSFVKNTDGKVSLITTGAKNVKR